MRNVEPITLRVILLLLFIGPFFFALPPAIALDSPHTPGYKAVSCASCHQTDDKAWWEDQESNVCGSCHNDVTAAKVQTHRKDSGVIVQCVGCHHPHEQRQDRRWGATSLTSLYTSTSDSTPGSITATTLRKTGANWSDHEWKGKLLLPDVRYPAFIYHIDDNTSTTITISTNNGDSINTSFCFPGATFAIVYGKFVKDIVNNRDVKFFRPTDANSFADSDAAVIDGICQVCHNSTTSFNQIGTLEGPGHPSPAAGKKCTSCHDHKRGFKPSCTSCHGNPPVDPSIMVSTNGSSAGTTGSQTAGAHTKHATTAGMNYVCVTCHVDSAGSGSTHNQSFTITLGFSGVARSGVSANSVYNGQQLASYNTSTTTTVTQNTGTAGNGSLTCSNIYCHSTVQADGGSGAPTYKQPVWDGLGTVVCGSCHKTTAAAPGGRIDTGSHSKHLGSAMVLMQCGNCHTNAGNGTSYTAANHINYNIEVANSYSQVANPPGNGYGTCSTASCHTDGRGTWTGSLSTKTTPTWGDTAGCGACHGNTTYTSDYRVAAPLYPSTTAVSPGKPNAHRPHTSTSSLDGTETQCKHCHYDTTTTNNTITGTHTTDNAYTVVTSGNPANMYARGEDVSAPAQVTMTYTYNGNPGTSTCSNSSCHPAGTDTSATNSSLTLSWDDAATFQCDDCHKLDLTRTSGYHHSMNNTNYVSGSVAAGDYPTTVPQADYTAGTNPTSRTCLMCHVKHNVSSDRMNTDAALTQPRAMNLRTDITQAPTQAANYTNTDFINSGTYGICVSCHSTSLVKDQGRQKPDPLSASTPTISGLEYSASSHSYSVALTTKTGAKTFNASCSKCHDARNGETASFYTGTNVGTHDSNVVTNPIRRLLSALGITMSLTGTDSLEENFCYRCHSQNTDIGNPGGGPAKPTANKDYYSSQTMTSPAEYIYRDITASMTGTASSGAADSITDSARGVSKTAWTASQWIGYTVKIVSGNGAGQGRRITSSASTSLTVTPNWTTIPNNTSVYVIGSVHDMGLASGKHSAAGEGTASNDGTLSGANRHVECEDCHNPHTAGAGKANTSGTVANSTASSLTANGAPNWPADRWKGYLVNITQNGRGQARYITGNTADTITIAGVWSTNPVQNDTFTIVSKVWEDGGLATDGGPATLVDTSRSDLDAYTGYFVRTISGAGEGQIRKINSVSGGNTLNVNPWTTAPTASTGYVIYKPPMVAPVNAGVRNVVEAKFETVNPSFSGPNMPTILSDPSGRWTNPTNALSDDGQYAVYSGTTQDDLVLTGYNLNVPAGAIVTGIEVVINGYNQGNADSQRMIRVGLTWNGALRGTRKTWPNALTLNNTEGDATAGASFDLWGATWTPSQINDTSFGVLLSDFDTNYYWPFYIDSVSVKVYYSQTYMRKTAYEAKATAEYQYEICLKCHSTWAYGTETNAPNVPSPYAANNAYDKFQTIKQQTDVGKDFDPDNYAYHPLFAPGRYQPIRMGNATGAVGQSIAYTMLWPYVAPGNYPYSINDSTGTVGGTVTATNGSKIVTGSGTTFPLGAGAGWWIWINTVNASLWDRDHGYPATVTTSGIGGGGRGWWPVASRDNTTQLTLAVPFVGPSGGNSTFVLTKGFKSTFVDGWGPESLLTCTDCHNTTDNVAGAANVTKARGPHGSANRWLLRFYETQTVTDLNGTVTTVGPTNPANPFTFCLNCHSQLVYGNAAIGNSATPGDFTPGPNAAYSRMNHTKGNNSAEPAAYCMSNYPTPAYSGNQIQINCTNCHAGQGASYDNSQPSVGSLHGNNLNFTATPTTGNAQGFRFMNGAAWSGHSVDPNTTGCYTAVASSTGAIASCAQHQGAGITVNYKY